MRALVADDEVTTRLLLQRLVAGWGYEVSAVSDGSQAWEVLSSTEPPEVAVLDWMMPGLDGVDVCRRLRQAGSSHYVYVVLITHREGAEDLSFALDSGADDFVRKPIDPSELRSRLAVGHRVAEYEARVSRYARDMEALADSRARQLVHADRMATLGMLSAGVAHEVRNPATFIAGNVQTVKRFWADAAAMLRGELAEVEDRERKKAFILEEMPRALNGIHDGVRRIEKIVKGLQAYARRGEGTRRAPCQLEGCVDRALDLSRYQLRDVQVERVVADGLPDVLADATQIEQVLVNLLVNAVQAMAGQAEPRVQIEVRGAGDHVGVCVQDSGPGIGADILDRIWEPFFTTKAAGAGTGLGLAICKGIVEEHQGTITAENVEGGGVRFCVRLPVATGGKR